MEDKKVEIYNVNTGWTVEEPAKFFETLEAGNYDFIVEAITLKKDKKFQPFLVIELDCKNEANEGIVNYRLWLTSAHKHRINAFFKAVGLLRKKKDPEEFVPSETLESLIQKSLGKSGRVKIAIETQADRNGKTDDNGKVIVYKNNIVKDFLEPRNTENDPF